MKTGAVKLKKMKLYRTIETRELPQVAHYPEYIGIKKSDNMSYDMWLKEIEITEEDQIQMYMKRYPNIMMNGFSGADLRQAYFKGIEDVLSKFENNE